MGVTSRMAPCWGFHYLNHWEGGGANWHYFRLTDNAFALMPWMAKPYSIRQPTREERIANYRISKGRSLVKNAL